MECAWERRRGLLSSEISAACCDVVAIQEVAPESFESDWSFMAGLGYDAHLMFGKKGRFRPATFWKTSKVSLIDAAHRDRCLLTLFELSDTTKRVVVVNAHLQAGPEGGRRLRQTLEALEHSKKLFKKAAVPEEEMRVVFCGDLNGEDDSAAHLLLTSGRVHAGFVRETARNSADLESGSETSVRARLERERERERESVRIWESVFWRAIL